MSSSQETRDPPNEFGKLPDWVPATLGDAKDIPTVVGAWRSKDENVVIPQYPGWDHLNIPEMLWECFHSATLSTTMEWKTESKGAVCLHDNPLTSDIRVLWIAPKEAPIELSRDDALLDSGHVLVALAFIAELRRLLLRSRRLEFQPETRNLVGRIKGKPLVQRNLRENVVRGRLDRITCQFLSRTMDNPVNRVFKCTLKRCRTLLKRRGATGASLNSVWTAASFCDSVLADVALLSHLRDSDFNQPGLRGFYRGHANILNLARAVHRNFIYAKESKSGDNASTKTVPFLINTPHLCERWVIARAQRVAEAKKWSLAFPQKAEPKLGDGFISFAPDMVFKKDNQVRILDAKYKKFWENIECPDSKTDRVNYDDFRHDLHQILAYQSVFSAERVGIIFPSSGAEKKRDSLQPHPVGKNPLLWTLAVDPKCPDVDHLITAFLNES